MENLSLSVPDLLQTVKNYVGAEKHEQLDEMLRRYTSKQLGKQQLQFELRVVAGRDALRQALLAMVPQIDELQKKREAMKQQQQVRDSRPPANFAAALSPLSQPLSMSPRVHVRDPGSLRQAMTQRPQATRATAPVQVM